MLLSTFQLHGQLNEIDGKEWCKINHRDFGLFERQNM